MYDPNQKRLAAFADRVLSRRGFLDNVYTGLAGIGLAHLLGGELRAGGIRVRLRAHATAWQPGRGQTHFAPKARRVLQVFCPGAASHMDLWEHKPALDKWHGQPLPGEENFVSFQGKNGNLMKSPWPFVASGQSGKRISSLLPHMARHVDDIAFVHSMTSKTNTHGPGCVFMNTGHVPEGFPSAGAWVSYALGSANENLPTYVAIPDIRGEPPNGKANWSNGFLPAAASGDRAQRPAADPQSEAAERNLGGRRSRPRGISCRCSTPATPQRSPGNSELQARVAAYELAARMQLSAPEVTDLAAEPRVDPPAVRHRGCQSAEGRLCSRTACWPAGCWNAASATSTCTARRGPPAWTGC